MGLLVNLIISAAHIVLVGIDTLFFLLLVRMLCCRWPTRWLVALSSMGQPAVQWFTGYIEKGLCHLSKKQLSERMLLFTGMLALSVVRLLLAALFNWVVLI